jgi:hypothetical protein
MPSKINFCAETELGFKVVSLAKNKPDAHISSVDPSRLAVFTHRAHPGGWPDLVAESGLVAQHNKKYRLKHLPRQGSTNKIVLILDHEAYARIPFFSYMRSWLYIVLHTLERECANRNLALAVKLYTGDDSIIDEFGDALGFIVFPVEVVSEEKVRSLVRSALKVPEPAGTAVTDRPLVGGSVAMQQVRALMFIERFASDVQFRLDQMDTQ